MLTTLVTEMGEVYISATQPVQGITSVSVPQATQWTTQIRYAQVSAGDYQCICATGYSVDNTDKICSGKCRGLPVYLCHRLLSGQHR